jgi:hypothetical protein
MEKLDVSFSERIIQKFLRIRKKCVRSKSYFYDILILENKQKKCSWVQEYISHIRRK